MTQGLHSVLFICTANRIRSVMAEALLRERVRMLDPSCEWRIGSAGTWAADGLPPMPHAIRAMAERGIDVSEHRSQSVDHAPLDSYQLILVMERGHKESLNWEFPSIAGRVYLLTEMAGDSSDVGDPVMGTLHDHLQTADAIEQYMSIGFERIRELSIEKDSANPG